ncbi:P-loop containing nucleoside triphosphate hydrolase protein [Hyaloraphidium curvatum]|nr:P-loop containing nucleoside triphosphate hydrolase protein [Hyaloraphidium curvatum]
MAESRVPQLVVVISGVPGSGKTTIGRPLARALGLPFLDKDDILEALFDSLGCGSPAERQRLSRAADGVLRCVAENARGAVLCSFWRPPGLAIASGTPCDWLQDLGARIIELRCMCPPDVAAARFAARKRHPGHQDAVRTPADLREQLGALDALGPLGVGALIEIDATGGVDVDRLAARVALLWKS